MSQHLFGLDRLAVGGSERLIAEGYPLDRMRSQCDRGARAEHGAGVQRADAGQSRLPPAWRPPLALLDGLGLGGAWGYAYVGLTYLLAFFVQGAFKETRRRCSCLGSRLLCCAPEEP